MLGCSTTCPKCRHEYTCCPPASTCCNNNNNNQRRSQHVLSGGGLLLPSSTTTADPPCSPQQVSPSTPLAFIIPPLFAVKPPLLPLLPLPSPLRPDSELQRLGDIERALRQSGWYYEGISYKTSDELLRSTPVGTFLVRNSADPRYLFSLSVQTERGPTSVRLCYVDGCFRLEARPNLQADMPLFPGVVELVEYYVRQFRYSSQVWVDPQGKFYSAMVLGQPLRKRPPALKHLARLAIHRAVQQARPRVHHVLPPAHRQLELPSSLEDYLGEYPHSV